MSTNELRFTRRKTLSRATFSGYHVMKGDKVVATIIGHVTPATWGSTRSANYWVVAGDAMEGGSIIKKFGGTTGTRHYDNLTAAKEAVLAGALDALVSK